MAQKRARKLAEEETHSTKKRKTMDKAEGEAETSGQPAKTARVFVGKMPLAVDVAQLKAALVAGLEAAAEPKGQIMPSEPVKVVQWLTDKNSGGFRVCHTFSFEIQRRPCHQMMIQSTTANVTHIGSRTY